MKGAVLAFLVSLGVVIAVAAAQGKLEEGWKASLRAGVLLGPVLIIAVFVTGFTEVILPQGWVERWLSDAAGLRGMGIAWLAGVLTPGGSVIGIPLAAGLLRTGASPAVVVTYLTSMATLSLVRIPMEAGIYGLRLALLRVASCLLIPFVAGAMARLLGSLA